MIIVPPPFLSKAAISVVFKSRDADGVEFSVYVFFPAWLNVLNLAVRRHRSPAVYHCISVCNGNYRLVVPLEIPDFGHEEDRRSGLGL